MSLLDPLVRGSEADLGPLQAAIDAVEAINGAQQTQLDGIAAQLDGFGDAQAAIDTIQNAAIDAAEAVNTAQSAAQAAIEAAQSAAAVIDATHSANIAALQTTVGGHTTSIGTLSSTVGTHGTTLAAAQAAIAGLQTVVATAEQTRIVDVRRFVAGGVLTNANIDDGIDAAIAWAVINTPGGMSANGVVIYVPAGVWQLSRGHVFPQFGDYRIAIGLRGAGQHETIFRPPVGASANAAVFTFGAATSPTGTFPHTMYLHLSDFSVLGPADATDWCGVRVYGPVNPLIQRLRIHALFSATCTDAQGIGIDVQPVSVDGVETNSMFVVIRDCDVTACMTGLRVRHAYLVAFDNLHVHGNLFHSAILEAVQGSWRNSDAQFMGGPTQFPDRWYGQRRVPGIVTGYSRTAGLASGSGATCAAESGLLCLVTGLLGLDPLIDRGRWLRLTPAGSSANELKVRGVYKIDSVVNATSCYIRKGSNHTSQASLTWQVCQAQGNTDMLFENLYAEGSLHSMFGCWRDDTATNAFTLRNIRATSLDFIVESDGVNKVRVEDPVLTNQPNKLARIWMTTESHVDGTPAQIEVDDYSYPLHSCYSTWQKMLPSARRPRAIRDAGGGSATRLISAFEEMGFAEVWHAGRTSSITLVGSDATAMAGLFHGSPAVPAFNNQPPQYTPHDAALDGPCITNVAGNHLTGRAFTATIDADYLPDRPFVCSVFLIGRLTTLVLPADMRRFGVRTTDLNQIIGLNDGIWMPANNYVLMEGPLAGSVLSPFAQTANTEPHAWVWGRHPEGGNAWSSDDGADYERQNPAAHLLLTHTVGQDLTVQMGAGATSVAPAAWSVMAVKAGPLSHAEQRKLIDLSRNAFPLEV